jgi:hypothetical protein
VNWPSAPGILSAYEQECRPPATEMITLDKLMGRLAVPCRRTTAARVHGAMVPLRAEIRPDRTTIPNDAPVAGAERGVRESLALLEAAR